MRRLLVYWAFLFAFALTLALVPRVSFAQLSAGPLGPSSTTLAVQVRADSLRVIGRVFPRADGAGPVDSVRWALTVNGTLLTRTTRRTADTMMVLRAQCPAPTTVALTATAYRRNAWSAATTTRTAGCRDPLALDSVVIDTGNVWIGALRVDSLPTKANGAGGWYDVLRGDSAHAMVHAVYDPKTKAVVGATVRAATTCDGMWWPTGDTTSVRVAQARAAQWPADTLTARATRAFKAFDYSMWPTGQVWQGRCG